MALAPELRGVGGGFFGERRPLEASAEARDPQKAERFWALASALTRSGSGPRPAAGERAQRQ